MQICNERENEDVGLTFVAWMAPLKDRGIVADKHESSKSPLEWFNYRKRATEERKEKLRQRKV